MAVITLNAQLEFIQGVREQIEAVLAVEKQEQAWKEWIKCHRRSATTWTDLAAVSAFAGISPQCCPLTSLHIPPQSRGPGGKPWRAVSGLSRAILHHVILAHQTSNTHLHPRPLIT